MAMCAQCVTSTTYYVIASGLIYTACCEHAEVFVRGKNVGQLVMQSTTHVFNQTEQLILKCVVALKRAESKRAALGQLASETVQRTTLTLQCVHDIHGRDGLPLGVFRIRDSIADDVLQENFEHTSCFFVDQARDTLDATSSCETSNSWLRDALDVIAQHLSMALSATLSQSFSSFASSRHV